MNKSTYTLQKLLNEIKSSVPSFKVGQLFETVNSIYPDVNIPRSKKNITFNGISFTKPLANSRKAKQTFIKEDSPVAGFFKNTSRGDFLKIIKIKGKKAYCVNLSLKDEIREGFYKDEYVEIDYIMVANGTVKPYKRKNIEKYFND